jgi:hypothetical protein
MDSIFIFNPEGISRVEIYGDGSTIMKPEKLRKREHYLGRAELDSEHRVISTEILLPGSYSVVEDRFEGYHSKTYKYRYPSENELVIDYANTRDLTKFAWIYKDSLLQECRYYQGEYPFLQAFWKWTYADDTLLTEVVKYDADTIIIYHSSYTYTDFGKVNQIQTTTAGKKVSFAIYEYNENQRLINASFFKSLKKVPRDYYAIKDGIFVRKSSRPISEENIRADRWIYKYDREGRKVETIQLKKSGDLRYIWLWSYTPDGKIESKSHGDYISMDGTTDYAYNESGQIVSIKYRAYDGTRAVSWYTFEYDERGNVACCFYKGKRGLFRVDFEYDYVEKN